MADAKEGSRATDADTGRRSHTGLVVVVLVIAILAAAYAFGIIFFATHAMPNTTINGVDVSWRSVDDMQDALGGAAASWSATVEGDGIDLSIAASDIDYAYDTRTMAEQALDQIDASLWAAELARPHDLTVEPVVSYDRDRLADLVGQAVDKENARRSEATQSSGGTVEIAFDEDSRKFAPKDSDAAFSVSRDGAIEAVEDAIDAGETTVTLDDSELEATGAFDGGIETANGWLSAAMDLYLGSDKAASLTPEQIAAWVSFDDSGTPTLDTDAIASWAQGDLADELDTVGATRSYTRPDGKEVTVSGGSYGWKIDGAQLASLVTTAIENGDSSDITIPCTQEAATVDPGGADFGTHYLDVDLTEQHARLYGTDDDGNDDAVLWESDVVTGNTDGEHETPEGTYYITSKLTDVTLMGPEVDGKPEWETPVKYWFGVVGSRIGLHSAQWRSQFGGSIYTYYGSHGCINISEAKAEEIYPLIDVGLPVVIHS